MIALELSLQLATLQLRGFAIAERVVQTIRHHIEWRRKLRSGLWIKRHLEAMLYWEYNYVRFRGSGYLGALSLRNYPCVSSVFRDRQYQPVMLNRYHPVFGLPSHASTLPSAILHLLKMPKWDWYVLQITQITGKGKSMAFPRI